MEMEEEDKNVRARKVQLAQYLSFLIMESFESFEFFDYRVI
jgi:hypothetical protein